MSTIETALAAIRKAETRKASGRVRKGAEILLRQPWRICEAIPWASGMDLDALVREARELKDVMRGLAGSHYYDSNLMISRRQVYVAARVLRLRERARSVALDMAAA